MGIYFVYVYWCGETPFYVGMGKNTRDKDHLRAVKKNKQLHNEHFQRKIKKMLAEGIEPDIIRVQEKLTEDDAKALEIKLIALYGRADLGKGPLTNHTDGGDGYVGWSDEAKEQLAAKKRGKGIVKDQDGNKFSVLLTDPRFISGELVGMNKGIKTATGNLKGLVMVKNVLGEVFRIPKTDQRFLSGELVGINKGKVDSPETIAKKSVALKGIPKPKPEGFRETCRKAAQKREAAKRLAKLQD